MHISDQAVTRHVVSFYKDVRIGKKLDYEWSPFSSEIVERTKRERAFLSRRRVSLFSRGMIFKRARVLLAVLPEEKWGLLVV